MGWKEEKRKRESDPWVKTSLGGAQGRQLG